ncbi:MAG: hypothetical protein JKY31_10990 [Rhodobacteraceae bacterium]|nr:hypothetical protein [Paracoccaceae bacterium]
MKKLLTTVVLLASASAAAAGNLAYVAPQVEMLENPGTMGGSGAWLIPLVIVAVLALALTSTRDETDNCTSRSNLRIAEPVCKK